MGSSLDRSFTSGLLCSLVVHAAAGVAFALWGDQPVSNLAASPADRELITFLPPPPPPPEPRPEPPTPPPEVKPEPPPLLRLGIEDSKADTPAWLGFLEETEHSAQRGDIDQSAMELQPGTPGPIAPPAPASPSPPKTSPPADATPAPPASATAPAPAPAVSPRPADAPAGKPPSAEPLPVPRPTPAAPSPAGSSLPAARPDQAQPAQKNERPPVEEPVPSPEPAPREPASNPAPSPAPNPVTPPVPDVERPADARVDRLSPPPLPADEPPVIVPALVEPPAAIRPPSAGASESKPQEAAPGESPKLEIPDSLFESLESLLPPVPFARPASPTPSPEELESGWPDPPPQLPAPTPAQELTVEGAAPPQETDQSPARPAVTPGSDRRPGEAADREADASSAKPIRVDRSKLGKVLAGEGISIRTSRPHWSTTTLLTTSPKNPVVRVKFSRAGKVLEADFVDGQNSGYDDVDGPLLDAIHRWTATGKKLREISDGDPAAGLTIMFTITLR